MYKIRILSIGKTKETWLDEAIGEYLKRLQPIATFDFVWAKNDQQLVALVQKEPLAFCLDPQGKMLDSPQFSSFFLKQLEKGHSRLAIVIGGATGLPSELRDSLPLISFSPMTFTHQIVRLVLIEQIYRAFEIEKGSQYHK